MEYAYGNWLLVLFNVIIFLVFLKSVFKPRTKTDWQTYKIFGAFLVALFAEMYGFPLTIYLLTSYLGNSFLNLDFTHNSGHLLNTLFDIKGDPHFSPFHLISYGLIIGGFILITKGWDILYKAQKENKLATAGVYHYIRHPQYLGFILIIFGFLFQWPTFITLLMAPILIVRYIHLGKKEEKVMSKKFGGVYAEYKSKTSGYLPSLKTLSGILIRKLTI